MRVTYGLEKSENTERRTKASLVLVTEFIDNKRTIAYNQPCPLRSRRENKTLLWLRVSQVFSQLVTVCTNL